MQDLVGFVLPFFVDFINKNVANSQLRFAVSLLAAAVVATVLNLDKLQSGSWEELLGKIGLVFAEAQLVYKLYWEKSAVRENVLGDNAKNL